MLAIAIVVNVVNSITHTRDSYTLPSRPAPGAPRPPPAPPPALLTVRRSLDVVSLVKMMSAIVAAVAHLRRSEKAMPTCEPWPARRGARRSPSSPGSRGTDAPSPRGWGTSWRSPSTSRAHPTPSCTRSGARARGTRRARQHADGRPPVSGVSTTGTATWAAPATRGVKKDAADTLRRF